MSSKLSSDKRKRESYSTDEDSETYLARPLQQIMDEVAANSHAGKTKVKHAVLLDAKNEVIRAKQELIEVLRANNDALQLAIKKLQRAGRDE